MVIQIVPSTRVRLIAIREPSPTPGTLP
jgi:hypothetical protein